VRTNLFQLELVADAAIWMERKITAVDARETSILWGNFRRDRGT